MKRKGKSEGGQRSRRVSQRAARGVEGCQLAFTRVVPVVVEAFWGLENDFSLKIFILFKRRGGMKGVLERLCRLGNEIHPRRFWGRDICRQGVKMFEGKEGG